MSKPDRSVMHIIMSNFKRDKDSGTLFCMLWFSQSLSYSSDLRKKVAGSNNTKYTTFLQHCEPNNFYPTGSVQNRLELQAVLPGLWKVSESDDNSKEIRLFPATPL